MALTLDQINSITSSKFMPKLEDNIFDTNPVFKKLYGKGETTDGGVVDIMPLEYAVTAQGGFITRTGAMTLTDTEAYIGAQYTIVDMFEPIKIYRRDELQNSGDSQKIDFVKAKIKSAKKNMENKFGTALFATQSNGFAGFDDMIAVTGTYGEIDKAAKAYWQSQVTNLAGALTLIAMQTMFGSCCMNGSKPDMIPTTQAVWNSYHNLLTPNMRYMDEKQANAGIQNLMYNTAMVHVDSHCTSGHMFFLTTDNIHVKSHSKENMRFEPFMQPEAYKYKVGKIFWSGVVGADNCAKQGDLYGIT